MSQYANYFKEVPEPFKHLYAFSTALAKGFSDQKLRHLLWLRASQINGCAFCINMHTTEALRDGEDARRLTLVSAWRETGSLFTPAERAALAWTEALTLLPNARETDHTTRQAALTELEKHFSKEQIIALAYAIASINAWNRLGVGFDLDPSAH